MWRQQPNWPHEGHLRGHRSDRLEIQRRGSGGWLERTELSMSRAGKGRALVAGGCLQGEEHKSGLPESEVESGLISHVHFPLFWYLVSPGWGTATNLGKLTSFNLPPPQCQGEAVGPEGPRVDPPMRGLPLGVVIGEPVFQEPPGSPSLPKGP